MKISVSSWRIRPLLRLKIIVCFVSVVHSYAALAQQIRGKVTDAKGEAIVGATALMKGTVKGTSTNGEGVFEISNLTNGTYTLVVSYIGYAPREVKATVPGSNNLTIRLQETTANLEEVVVTGVFDKRERMDASIAISTLSAKQIAQQVPYSAADLLKNVPGVYVNSSLGEVNNTVYSRGVTAGGAGYYYVSMQEDGLPVTNVNFGGYGPDYFLRADATTGRLEAVRGGSAAITGPNAPGGIFNYVSKTGSSAFEGEIRAKVGLEGNAQPYYRADVNLGGKLNDKGDLTYNVGGFYRYANGVRYPGYPMNRGGQVKFNLVKNYSGGSLKLYVKYLDDHNSYFEALPAVNFDKPQLAPGVSKTDTYLPNQSVVFKYPFNSPTDIRDFDISKAIHNLDRAIGLDWQHKLGKGWSFQNNIKYSNKSRDWNAGLLLGPVELNSLYTYAVAGALGNFGNYTFTDATTGKPLATYSQLPNIVNGQFAGFNFTKTSTADLPGTAALPNSLLLSPLQTNHIKIQEVIDQVSVSKKVNDQLSFTLGGYLGASHLTYDTGLAGLTLSTVENNPHPVSMSAVGLDGKTYQYTNAQGVAAVGFGSFNTNEYRQTQLSGFGAITWKITPALTFDGGLRYDHVRIHGSNLLGMSNPAASAAGFGGVDGNPLTVYDNMYSVAGTTPVTPDKTFQTVSFSGALNYRFSPYTALYARFSDGKKAPDLSPFMYLDANSAPLFDPKIQRVQQVEAGVKVQRSNWSLFATPFYSILSGIPASTFATTVDNSYYFTPTIYNSIQTYGLELEGNYNLTQQFSVRAVATLQRSFAKNWGVWITGNPGPQDDVVQDFSGYRTENVPNLMINVSPTYTMGKFSLFGSYRYMGNRAANVPNAFFLPGFSQLDLGASYTISKALSLQANVNNVTNTLGMMGFIRPGGFPVAADLEGFTVAQREANASAVYAGSFIQPRSYYLTAIYKF
jgi:iron complex outermembrane receptor protein